MTRKEIQRRLRIIRKASYGGASWKWEVRCDRGDSVWNVNGIMNMFAPSDYIDSWGGDIEPWETALKNIQPHIEVDFYIYEMNFEWGDRVVGDLYTNIDACVALKSNEDIGYWYEISESSGVHFIDFKTGEEWTDYSYGKRRY